MAESGRMTKSGLFTHFAERFGIKRAEAGEFFDELQQLTEQELLRCGESPGFTPRPSLLTVAYDLTREGCRRGSRLGLR